MPCLIQSENIPRHYPKKVLQIQLKKNHKMMKSIRLLNKEINAKRKRELQKEKRITDISIVLAIFN